LFIQAGRVYSNTPIKPEYEQPSGQRPWPVSRAIPRFGKLAGRGCGGALDWLMPRRSVLRAVTRKPGVHTKDAENGGDWATIG